MSKSANDRLIKWKSRYAGDSQPLCVTAPLKDNIEARLSQIFSDHVDVEDAVKSILAEAGTPVIYNGFYHGFGKQVWSAMGKFAGAQLLNEVDVLLNSWVAKGMDRDILERIRNTVFAIGAPPPPTP